MISVSMQKLGGAMLALAVLVGAAELRAESLPQPTGEVLLTVEGNIGATNRNGAADFDLTMLREIGWQAAESYTDWTEGPQMFEGVPLDRLLQAVQAKGDMLRAVALNDYAVEIPASDAAEYDVLLAIRRNGEAMPVRDKGPIWIIYPQADSSTRVGAHNDKMVWQLRRIRVE